MKFGKIEARGGVTFTDLTELTTADIPYTNPDHQGLTTMRAALDMLLHKPLGLKVRPLLPVAFGQAIPYVDLVWELTKAPDSQSINGVGVIDNSLRTYRVQGPFTQTSTFSLTVASGAQSLSTNVTLEFNNLVYWGASGKESLTPQDIPALDGQVRPDRKLTRILSPNGKYLYFAWPSRLGPGSFKVNGMVNSAWVQDEMDVMNTYGYSEPYLIYRSSYIQNGTDIQVEVF